MMSSLLELMIHDYEKFDNNSVMLRQINDCFLSIARGSSSELIHALFVDYQLLEKCCSRFSLSEFTRKPT